MKWTATILVAIMIVVLLTGYILPEKDLQEDLSYKLLRFHVIANSDDVDDQQLKLKVRDEVIGYLNQYLASADSKEDAQRLISSKLDDIQQKAEEVVQSEGYNYPVKVTMGRFEFPIKSYGSITLPAGEYDALRVVMGDGEGKNWWCVLFPPLCFVDTSHGQARDNTKDELSKVLTEKEIEEISSNKPPIKLKSVEIIEDIASRVSNTFKLAFQRKTPE
ncbi:MAG: stage II sporulation protein R [Thermoanaerobacteraceae bacterium]|nr:stage II sporulation protein R [Thermoanaerobacteraceae bacterium]